MTRPRRAWPILAKNERGLVMLQDELTGWVRRMNQYRGGKGSDRQFFLSCWSGEPAIVDRKSAAEPIIIPRPFLNVVGGIQTDLLSVLMTNSGRSDGFLDRLLFSYPEIPEAGKWTEAGVGQEARDDWQGALDLLHRLQMQVNENEGIRLPRVVRFTGEARAEWIGVVRRPRGGGRRRDLPRTPKGPWSKLRSYAARLALTVHFLRLVCGEVDAEDVDAESVRRAIRLVDYFKSHTRKVHRQLERTPEEKRAEAVLVWVHKHDGRCTARQLQRNNVVGITRQSEAKRMIVELVDRGHGIIENLTAENGKEVSWFVAT